MKPANRTKILLSTLFVVLSVFLGEWGYSQVSLAAAQEVSDVHAAEIDAINRAIRDKGGQWIAGETSLTPLPLAERQRRVGLLYPLAQEEEEIRALQDQGILALPSSLDWRSNGGNFVTPIRDQGSCGSCWAFATTAATESAVMITLGTSGTDLNLAEQILVSCSGQGSCGGGYIHSTSTYIRDTGLPLESCYPYTATNGNCSSACANWPSSTYQITGWSSVSQSVDSIKNALYTYGPLVTTMDVYQDFFNYQSGIYSYVSGSKAGGHAILLVGYDDGGQYFTCKNSWGTWWGESGYFRIAYSQLSSVVKFGAYTIAYWDGVSPNSETVSTPSTPTGNTSGTTGSSYIYATSGSISSEGDSVQYLFDWGDGSNSGWLAVGTSSASKSWSSSGTYSVKAQARCATHNTVVSGMSGSRTVTISPPPETVSAPTTLSGQMSGTAGVSYPYTTGGSSSSYGHSIHYFFDWGDGSNSGWLAVGTSSASKSWSSSGTYSVKAQARCYTHNTVFSSWTNPISVAISAPIPGTLSITPSGGFSASGSQGGPFSPASQIYTLRNGGGTTLNWTASRAQNWVNLSSTSGALAAGASTTVTVSINSNANGLNPGNYSDTVTFTNTTNGNGNTTRPVALAVQAIPSTQVTVLAPNGGEIMPMGSTQTIRWDAPSQAIKFRLFYSVNNGATWKRITQNDVTVKTYSWIVPKLAKTKKQCLVKVVGYNSARQVVGSDRSDSPFTIEVARVTIPHAGEALR